MTKKHAKFSPSASSRWIACPASIKMSEDKMDVTTSYAQEGIVCHDIAAKCLKEHILADKFTGEVIDGVTITKELIEGIQMYVDEIRGLTKELKATGGRIEFEVTIDDDCWGTLDAALWNPDFLLVCDLKMGAGVIVEVENNPQLMIYAVGALKWLEEKHNFAPKKIILYIIQPRTVNPIRKWEIPREDLIEWYNDVLMRTIIQIKSGEVECVPGEDQCRWCLASATCTAQAEWAVKTAERAFAPFTEEVKPKQPGIVVDGKMSLKWVAELLPSFKHIKDWMNTLEVYALGQALDGIHVPGHKVVEGKSNRKWKVDEAVLVAFLKPKGYEAYDSPPLLSPAKVEKAMGKKEAEAHGLANLIHKPPGAKTLVVDSDKRPAIDIEVDKAFEEFAVIPESEILEETTKDVMGSMKEGEVILVSDEAEVKQLSALDRMMEADMEDEPVFAEIGDLGDDPEDEFLAGMFNSKPEFAVDNLDPESPYNKTATSGDLEIVMSVKSSGNAKPPLKAPKRLNVLNMGKGGVKLEEVAKALNCGINPVKMHLRYLHERDGYGYEIYSDGTFKMFE